MAGLFGAFSTFMMKALASLSDSEGIKAMQAINRFIVRPSFLMVFLGTAVLCIVAAVLEYNQSGVSFSTTAAAVIYSLACVVSTMAFNVPLNNRLDGVSPDSSEGYEFWQTYLNSWTRWNHLRSIATMLSTICLAISLSDI